MGFALCLCNTKAKLAIKGDFIMLQTLERYIEQNKVCSDLLLRDWNAFLDLLFDCGGAVNEILWFEYVLYRKAEEFVRRWRIW